MTYVCLLLAGGLHNVHVHFFLQTHTHTHTLYRALQHVVEKCGGAFEPHLNSDLIQLVFTSLSHTNRFVRETGYKVIAAIVMIPGEPCTRINQHYILHVNP